MPIELYQCIYCGTVYKDRQDAVACETLGNVKPRWNSGQTFRSQYYNISIELLGYQILLGTNTHIVEYKVRLSNDYLTTRLESEIVEEIAKGELFENHPKENNVMGVYYCSICGREHETQKLAEECESKGKPKFKYDSSWSMSNYDGWFVAYVVDRRIYFDRGKHIIQYGMQYRDGIEGHESRPSEHISEWVSEEKLDIATMKKYY